MKSENELARQRRRRAFRRRAAAAEAGLHLPSMNELLRLMPFMSGLRTDSQAFAERVLPRLDLRTDEGLALQHLLAGLTLQPELQDYRAAAEAFARFAGALGKRFDANECGLRCAYYAAALGCRQSAREVGLWGLAAARDRRIPSDLRYEYGVAALGWCLASLPESSWPGHFDTPRQSAWELGRILLEGLFEEYDDLRKQNMAGLREAMRDAVEEQEAPETEDAAVGREATGDKESDQPAGIGAGSVVVISALGNADIAGANHVRSEFRSVLRVPLPLIPVPDLTTVRAALLAEFPHADGVSDTLLEPLMGRPHVSFQPTILLGAPGSGKTTYAARLLSLLRVPHEVFPCGGVADSALVGSARRWASSEPSVPVSLVRQHRSASPGIILDELDKASTNKFNGSLYDALLSLLEPRSAANWLDPYLQAGVNLAHVIWLATANAVADIPSPLRDRCRILRFPEPSVDHLPSLATHLLQTMVAERGMHPRWALPLDRVELDALSAAWPGGSIRALARLLDAVLKARDLDAVRH